jgi:hypothetical protein
MNKAEAKQQHEAELEKNDLAEWGRSFWPRLMNGEIVGKKFLLLAVALGAAVALWTYIRSGAKSGDLAAWNALQATNGADALEEFAKTAKDSTVGKVAKIRRARLLLGPQGLQALSAPGSDAHTKAIKNIEEAREIYIKLADEFKNDLTLQAYCYEGAAKAELGLVGIPKAGAAADSTDYRGNLDTAIGYFEKCVTLAGAENDFGKAAAAKVQLLKDNRENVAKVQNLLNSKMSPTLGNEPKAPPTLGGLASPSLPGVTPPTIPAPAIPEPKN